MRAGVAYRVFGGQKFYERREIRDIIAYLRVIVNPADDLDQQDLPDIVAQRLTDLDRRLGALENAAQGDTPPTAAQIAARQKS